MTNKRLGNIKETTGKPSKNMEESMKPLGEKPIRSGKGAGGARYATKYSGDYPDRMRAWFQARANPIEETEDKFMRTVLVPKVVPSFAGFAAELGIPEAMIETWKEEHRGFLAAWEICRGIRKNALQELGCRIPGTAKYVLATLADEYGMGTKDSGAGDLPVPTYGPVGSTPVESEEEPEE